MTSQGRTQGRAGARRRGRDTAFGRLLHSAGKKPAHIEAEKSVSASTVYRAMRGEMPTDANVIAIAECLGKPVSLVRRAIEDSAPAAGAA